MSALRDRAGAEFHCAYVDAQTAECVYCGDPAASRDHVPPLRFASADIDGGPRMWRIYSACVECNSILGARPLMTLAERRRYLIGRYKTRFARLLEAPRWTEEDLAELGWSLRQAVANQEAQRERAQRRLSRLRRPHGA